MTPRESRRLLALLNASFKQQLDREHPGGLSSNEHRMDLHLQSILTNPLFSTKPGSHRSPPSVDKRGGDKSFGRIQDLVKGPMETFKEQISAGVATIEAATICLEIQYKYCLASSAVTPSDAMRSSATGTIMLEWLWSSGAEESGRFLENLKFLKHLIPFLVAEQQYTRVLRWLLIDPSPIQKPGIRKRQAYIFAILIKAEVEYGNGLASAISLFVRSITQGTLTRLEANENRIIFYPAGSYLTFALSRIPNGASVSTKKIDSFINTTDIWTDSNSLAFAWQRLHFLKDSDPEPALQYLQKLSEKAVHTLRAAQRLRVVLLSLKVSELLLGKGRGDEARSTISFLSANFAKEIGSYLPQTQIAQVPKETPKDEETNLRLLENLAVP